MNWSGFLSRVGEGFAKPLFAISGTQISLKSMTIFVVIISITYLLSRIFQGVTGRALKKGFERKIGALKALQRLIHYVVMLIGFGIALDTIGIKMSALFAAGAVFAIAIGFAMQNIVQNFVSGIILMTERSITPGDILEIDGTVVKVMDMGIRTTVVRTWKEEDIIIPNSELSQTKVKNFTQRDDTYRLGVVVGVTYDSDMHKVVEVMESVARKMPWRLADPEPRVLWQDFGSSSVDFGVYVSVSDPWKQRVYISEMREAIWFAFKEAGITIAFPQLDVHFDPPVGEGFAKLNKVV